MYSLASGNEIPPLRRAFGDYSLLGKDQALFAASVANTEKRLVARLCGISPASSRKKNPPRLCSSFVSTGDSPNLLEHFPFVL